MISLNYTFSVLCTRLHGSIIQPLLSIPLYLSSVLRPLFSVLCSVSFVSFPPFWFLCSELRTLREKKAPVEKTSQVFHRGLFFLNLYIRILAASFSDYPYRALR